MLGFSVGVAICATAGAQPATSTVSQPTASSAAGQTVSLEYRELGYSVLTCGLDLKSQSTPFKKEPNFPQRGIQRGRLFSRTEAGAVPFAWDQAQGKLYLDLNRNEDLTDDPAGVFSCPLRSPNANFQTFTNIYLTFPSPKGPSPALVDLNLYNFGQIQGNAACRWLWEGKVSLQGRDWQVGLIDNPGYPGSANGNYLLFRRWEARDEPFDVLGGSLEAFDFPQNLFFGRQGYQVSRTFERQADAPRYKLEFKEQPTELGELKVTGKFIRRALLTGSRYTIVLNTPDSVAKVPVGTYTRCQVSLRQGGSEAYRQEQFGNRQPAEIVVKAAAPATLSAGGPLTNTVVASRHGKFLNLSYELVGADGDKYQLQGARREPEFAVYKANKQIASGKFQFG